jgi:hypothetical protein
MHTYVQTVQSSTCSQVQSSPLGAPTTNLTGPVATPAPCGVICLLQPEEVPPHKIVNGRGGGGEPPPPPGPQESVGTTRGGRGRPRGRGLIRVGRGGGALSMPKWCPRDREEGRPEPGWALGWVRSIAMATTQHIPGGHWSAFHRHGNDFRGLRTPFQRVLAANEAMSA